MREVWIKNEEFAEKKRELRAELYVLEGKYRWKVKENDEEYIIRPYEAKEVTEKNA